MAESPLPVLVLQHLAAEHPGSIASHLRGAGAELITVELDEGDAIPDLRRFRLMVVMGGPMNVWDHERHPWLVEEKAAIRRWVSEMGRPFLGVCLGHQLLADALGGEVGRMPAPEVGVVPVHATPAASTDEVFASLPGAFHALQWHGAEVRRPPPGATVVATNPASPVQAFRVDPLAWGLQFHVEAEGDTVAQWCQIPAYRRDLERTHPGGVDSLQEAVAERLEDMRAAAGVITARLVGLARRIGDHR